MKLANRKVFVTTFDNPFNYFNDFENWFAWDKKMGWNTCGIMADLTGNISNLSPEETATVIEGACKRLVSVDILGIWHLVYDT